MPKRKENIQYYTMAVDRFMDLLSNAQKEHSVSSLCIKELVSKNELEEWETKGINELIETFVVIRSLKLVLEKKLNDPTKEEIDFCTKNNITDVLMSEEELLVIQSFVTTIDAQKEVLKSLYKINLTLH